MYQRSALLNLGVTIFSRGFPHKELNGIPESILSLAGYFTHTLGEFSLVVWEQTTSPVARVDEDDFKYGGTK